MLNCDRSTVKHALQNTQNDCYQWLTNSSRVHPIPLGLCPGPRWGSLQRSPRPPSWFKGAYFQGGEGTRKEGRGGSGRGRGGTGNGEWKGRGREEGEEGEGGDEIKVKTLNTPFVNSCLRRGDYSSNWRQLLFMLRTPHTEQCASQRNNWLAAAYFSTTYLPESASFRASTSTAVPVLPTTTLYGTACIPTPQGGLNIFITFGRI